MCSGLLEPYGYASLFDGFLRDKLLHGFTGRHRLFEAMSDWLRSASPAVMESKQLFLLIKGEPGIGKSTALCHLLKQRAWRRTLTAKLQACVGSHREVHALIAEYAAEASAAGG
jgi:hypothetical protein